jgi:hypothetical protein
VELYLVASFSFSRVASLSLYKLSKYS